MNRPDLDSDLATALELLERVFGPDLTCPESCPSAPTCRGAGRLPRWRRRRPGPSNPASSSSPLSHRQPRTGELYELV